MPPRRSAYRFSGPCRPCGSPEPLQSWPRETGGGVLIRGTETAGCSAAQLLHLPPACGVPPRAAPVPPRIHLRRPPAFLIRNIFSKKGMKGKSVSGMNYYACLSMLSLVTLLPFAFAMEGPKVSSAGWQDAVAEIGPNLVCSVQRPTHRTAAPMAEAAHDGPRRWPMVGSVQDAPGRENDLEAIELARFAVAEHNTKANAVVEFERLVKVRQQVVAGRMHYFTIEVREGGTKKLYEAKVWVKAWENFKGLEEFKPAA